MNVVGKVGSLISQGVYSVATPFHPFGGAVDIIVVEQPDGTYRSTPWYVRFGKFQGVLKGAEKIVTIHVNGSVADFHMFLDNSGQAYFMREDCQSEAAGEKSDHDTTKDAASESDHLGDTSVGFGDHENSYDGSEKGQSEDQSFSFQGEQPSTAHSDGSSTFNSYHYGSLEEVENMVKETDNSDPEMVLVSIDGHVLTAPISSMETNTDNVQLTTPQFHLGPGGGSNGDFHGSSDIWETGFFSSFVASSDNLAIDSEGNEGATDDKDAQGTGDATTKLGNSIALGSRVDTFKSCLDLSLQFTGNLGEDLDHLPVDSPRERISGNIIRAASVAGKNMDTQTISTIFSRDDSSLNVHSEVDSTKENVYSPQFVEDADIVIEVDSPKDCVCSSHVEDCRDVENEAESSKENDCIVQVEEETSVRECPSDVYCDELSRSKEDVPDAPGVKISTFDNLGSSGTSLGEKSPLGLEMSLCGNLLRPGLGRRNAAELFEARRVSEEEFWTLGKSILKNTNLIIRTENKYFQWNKVAHVVLGRAVFGLNFPLDTKDAIPVELDEAAMSREAEQGASSRWRLWDIPFRRSRSLQRSASNLSNEDLFVDSESVLSPTSDQNAENGTIQSPKRQFVRTKIPTSEQIASLNLKEGQNMIAFSFSTRVLGKQQVDAYIYLWKWNARVVISDVDGTITKSDVLGQFMPLVGRDWTQSGVARLFSAIKENGYQLLFLSARAIVQAYLTRSFLLNLKQDGKALPNGPIVISPDGLFPSLYREVIRRAPHEFKIACLQDIKALFPADYNPFYAGFGNRDTDELSYKKIGIPKGKIFIINPKGEVAINNCVDVKSYTSLHTLVNDMFPPTTLVEQEDYNAWNYWKMPLLNFDL